MPQVDGQIEKVYHNLIDRQGNNLPPNKVNHKLKIHGELYIIKGVHCPDFVKEGAKVSLAYSVWSNPSTKMDNYYVLTEDNRLCINNLGEKGNENNDLDDNLSQDEPMPDTSFDTNELEKSNTKPQDLKDQQIFCAALLKSSIEGKYLEPTEENLNKMILTLKQVFNKNFR